MRRAFTMIELIFVIVILGILAAVAIPKLTVTRDDAEIAKVATNLSTLVTDISTYYASQGSFASSFKEMTNVQVSNEVIGKVLNNGKQTISTASLKTLGKECLKISITTAEAGVQPATLVIQAGANATDSICAKILSIETVKTFTEATYKYTPSGLTTAVEKKGIAISGIGIKY